MMEPGLIKEPLVVVLAVIFFACWGLGQLPAPTHHWIHVVSKHSIFSFPLLSQLARHRCLSVYIYMSDTAKKFTLVSLLYACVFPLAKLNVLPVIDQRSYQWMVTLSLLEMRYLEV